MKKNINIRSITYSIDIDKIFNDNYLKQLKHNLKLIKNSYKKENYLIRTVRFNIVVKKFNKVPDHFSYIKKISNLSEICNELNIRWFNMSFDLSNESGKNIKSICNIG